MSETIKIINDFLSSYNARLGWDVDRMDRTRVLLPQLLNLVDGDILEIGAHRGHTTKILCEIAAKFSRNVYVLDPWDGRQDGNPDVYSEFLGSIASFGNCIVRRCGSESNEALKAVCDQKFAYVLIDGLHGYDAVRIDFTRYREFVNLNGVICIDDWTGPYVFSQQIQQAVIDNLTDNYVLLQAPDSLIERYVVRV